VKADSLQNEHGKMKRRMYECYIAVELDQPLCKCLDSDEATAASTDILWDGRYEVQSLGAAAVTRVEVASMRYGCSAFASSCLSRATGLHNGHPTGCP